MDVLLLCTEAIDPMVTVRSYPIGVISMIDNKRNDEKIIAIPYTDPTYNCYTDIGDLPEHVFDEMRHFFSVYKMLEDKETAVDEVQGRDVAVRIIQESIDRYNEKFIRYGL